MIGNEATYHAWFDYIEEMNRGEPSPFKDKAVKMKETIEALREVARAANAMNEADQMDEGVIFFDRVLPALDALPDWLTDG